MFLYFNSEIHYFSTTKMIITKANFIHFFGAIINVERTKVMFIIEILFFFLEISMKCIK